MAGDSYRVGSAAELPFTKDEVLRIVNDDATTPQERNQLLTLLFNTYVDGERLLSPDEQAAYRAEYGDGWQAATGDHDDSRFIDEHPATRGSGGDWYDDAVAVVAAEQAEAAGADSARDRDVAARQREIDENLEVLRTGTGYPNSSDIIDRYGVPLATFEWAYRRYQEIPAAIPKGGHVAAGASVAYPDLVAICDEMRDIGFATFRADAELFGATAESLHTTANDLRVSWEGNTADWGGQASWAAHGYRRDLTAQAVKLETAMAGAASLVSWHVDGIESTLSSGGQDIHAARGDATFGGLDHHTVGAFIDAYAELPGVIGLLDSAASRDSGDARLIRFPLVVDGRLATVLSVTGLDVPLVTAVPAQEAADHAQRYRLVLDSVTAFLADFVEGYEVKASEVHRAIVARRDDVTRYYDGMLEQVSAGFEGVDFGVLGQLAPVVAEQPTPVQASSAVPVPQTPAPATAPAAAPAPSPIPAPAPVPAPATEAGDTPAPVVTAPTPQPGAPRTPVEVAARAAYDAGFRGQDLVDMVAIAGRESGYDPEAHRTDQDPARGSGDRGLWQINYIWDDQLRAAGIIDDWTDLLDPAVNALAAKYVFDHQGLAAWGAGPGGWTEDGDAFYGTDRAEAERAARDLGLLDPAPAPADAPTPPAQQAPVDAAPPVLGGPSVETTPAPGVAPVTTGPREDRLQAALDYARYWTGQETAYVGGGSPYRFGGVGDGLPYQGGEQEKYMSPERMVGFDCSGLVVAAYQQAGVDLSGCACTGAMLDLPEVPETEIRPGDLLVKDGHVAIYLGDVDGNGVGDVVEATPYDNPPGEDNSDVVVHGVRVADVTGFLDSDNYTVHRVPDHMF
jgi:hypothetical protein